ncbi:serine O-acetyltransferase EpsC [Actinoplanes teichomyceticus]|uniref:Serine acetyltransferase n=1 Tax=Actinoplanes teichomyceticus TaxID=1867 RepID=A0A561WLV0_ACTTI|nr:serine O-acetyltransferase EpsC [Actinoplanes teichomyceticus]TWG24847.1 serine O-acetyltransferase [Actinoplanes teichomyceticus]GIF15622.1 hypothetical protein Ate01nite_56540 [Actinoplanes teichomyceticus]
MFEDIRAACRRDPALYGIRSAEVLLYPGLWAVWSHRLAHPLHRAGLPLLPRLLSQVTRLLTGIEIHPGAVIGRRLFIDHGAGVVIGETARIGDDVTVYHRVTLGGRGWRRDPKGSRRHPTVGDRVVLGVGATVLGPVRVGDDAEIGAHCLVTADVPAGARLRAGQARETPDRSDLGPLEGPARDGPVHSWPPQGPATDVPARRGLPMQETPDPGLCAGNQQRAAAAPRTREEQRSRR